MLLSIGLSLIYLIVVKVNFLLPNQFELSSAMANGSSFWVESINHRTQTSWNQTISLNPKDLC
jgi:hypothetical protein